MSATKAHAIAFAKTVFTTADKHGNLTLTKSEIRHHFKTHPQDKLHILGPRFTWERFFRTMDKDGDQLFDLSEFTEAIVRVYHDGLVDEDGNVVSQEEAGGGAAGGGGKRGGGVFHDTIKGSPKASRSSANASPFSDNESDGQTRSSSNTGGGRGGGNLFSDNMSDGSSEVSSEVGGGEVKLDVARGGQQQSRPRPMLMSTPRNGRNGNRGNRAGNGGGGDGGGDGGDEGGGGGGRGGGGGGGGRLEPLCPKAGPMTFYRWTNVSNLALWVLGTLAMLVGGAGMLRVGFLRPFWRPIWFGGVFTSVTAVLGLYLTRYYLARGTEYGAAEEEEEEAAPAIGGSAFYSSPFPRRAMSQNRTPRYGPMVRYTTHTHPS